MGKRSKSATGLKKANVRSSSTGSNQSWIQRDAMMIPNRVKDLESELIDAKKSADTYSAKVKLMRKKERETSVVVQDLKDEAKVAKELKRALAEKDEAIASFREAVEAKDAELEELRRLEATMAEAEAKHQKEVEKLQKKVRQYANDGKAKKKSMASVASDKAELEARVAQLEEELGAAQNENGQAIGTVSSMATKLNNKEEQVHELKARLQDLESDKAMQEDAAAVEIESLQAQVDKLASENEALTKNKEQNKALASELASVQAKAAALEEDKQSLTDELAVMTTALEEQQDELAKQGDLADKTAELKAEVKRLQQELKEASKLAAQKEKKVADLKKEAANSKKIIEALGEEKAERDERIRELTQQAQKPKSLKRHREMEEDELASRVERSRSIMSVESPRFVQPQPRLSAVSLGSNSTVEDPVSMEGTPYSQKGIGRQSMPNQSHRASVRTNQDIGLECPELDDEELATCTVPVVSVKQVPSTPKQLPTTPRHTPGRSKHTAPAVYAQSLTRNDKESYKAALDEQIACKRAQSGRTSRKSEPASFFKFGVAGSGAPIRDQNNDVVTNVTFTRSTNYLPVDHPMSTKKPKRPRHF